MTMLLCSAPLLLDVWYCNIFIYCTAPLLLHPSVCRSFTRLPVVPRELSSQGARERVIATFRDSFVVNRCVLFLGLLLLFFFSTYLPDLPKGIHGTQLNWQSFKSSVALQRSPQLLILLRPVFSHM